MPGKVSAAKPFELIAGHVALDFVNTLDNRFAESGPVELLTSYEELVRFGLQSGLITERQFRKLKKVEAAAGVRQGVLREALRLRELLATVCYALTGGTDPEDAKLEELAGILKEAAARRELLVRTEGEAAAGDGMRGLVWKFKGVGRELASPVWLLAQAAGELLVSEQVRYLRTCASDTCGWLFLDTSKNHTRRWCDMRICGNRNKVREFQRRQSAAG